MCTVVPFLSQVLRRLLGLNVGPPLCGVLSQRFSCRCLPTWGFVWQYLNALCSFWHVFVPFPQRQCLALLDRRPLTTLCSSRRTPQVSWRRLPSWAEWFLRGVNYILCASENLSFPLTFRGACGRLPSWFTLCRGEHCSRSSRVVSPACSRRDEISEFCRCRGV